MSSSHPVRWARRLIRIFRIVRKDPRTLLREHSRRLPQLRVLNGTEDRQLETDDVIRPISVDEAQMLTFVLKTYLAKLSY